MFDNELKERFSSLAQEHNLLEEPVSITARILKNEEAIGNPTRQDYPLLKGKEFLMEAKFHECCGQAFTDAPSERVATLSEIIDLPLDNVPDRAIFIATLNAVMRFVKPEFATIHCHDDEPETCADEIIKQLQNQAVQRVGLIGLQPAILENLAKTFGPDNVICIDRDENMRNSEKFGVPIKWGDEKEAETLFAQSDVVLSTGSTIVNGSLAGFLSLAEKYKTGIYFYGTTIAGAAELMGLQRFCFKST